MSGTWTLQLEAYPTVEDHSCEPHRNPNRNTVKQTRKSQVMKKQPSLEPEIKIHDCGMILNLTGRIRFITEGHLWGVFWLIVNISITCMTLHDPEATSIVSQQEASTILAVCLTVFSFNFTPDVHHQVLTCWVPHDGYIRHQNDHLSGHMTDISVMGEWQVAGVGGTQPLWNVLGEAIEGRFSFEARNYLFSFQSYVRFEEFFVSRAFERFGAKMFKLLVSTMFWGSLWKLRSFTGHFLRTLTTTTSISWKFPFFFPKQSRFYLPDSYGDPKSEQTLWWWYVEN